MRVVLTLVIVAAATLVPVMPAGAANRTPLDANLVENPGAEAGDPSPDGWLPMRVSKYRGEKNLCDLVGCGPHYKWSRDNGSVVHFTVVAYGTGDFPTVTEGDRIHGGNQFLSAGPATAHGNCDGLSQLIHVYGRGDDIDLGHIAIVASADVATQGPHDRARIQLIFLDAELAPVGTTELPTGYQTHGFFERVKTTEPLPRGTRAIRLVLWEKSHDGAYCNAYFDNLDARLSTI